MNLNTNEGGYALMEKKRKSGHNHSMMDPNINSTLLEKTLHEESFEKLGESIVNSNAGFNFEKGAHNDMPLLDKITMGPIQKYQKWNRYPWKMLIHIFLIALTTMQVLITIQADTNYSRTHSRLMDRIFLTPEGSDDDLSDRHERYIFNIAELQTFMQNSVSNYYSLNDKSLEKYSYFKNNEGEIKNIRMDVQMVDAGSYQLRHTYYYLNHSYLGPFGVEQDDLKGKHSNF
jgi:hypothetical protein